MVPTWLTNGLAVAVVVLGGIVLAALILGIAVWVLDRSLRHFDMWWNFILWYRDKEGRKRVAKEAAAISTRRKENDHE